MTDTARDDWPELPFLEWQGTCATLHMVCQIVGKVRLALTPWINHSWHATLYVTARGLTTSLIPHGARSLEIELDLVHHALVVRVADGRERRLALSARPVAELHTELLAALGDLQVPVHIHGRPNEVPDPIRFADDRVHRTYVPEHANRFWRVLLQVDRVLKLFRTGFLGKASPVHLFWGSLDMAVTRFSGRPAPAHPGGIPNLPDAITREAYSHEVSSAGFWPGTAGGLEYPAFYSYAYPAPAGFAEAAVRPAEAFFHPPLGEFVLPYDAVRTAADPDGALLDFLQSTYEAAADRAGWDRAALECAIGRPGAVRAV